MVSTLVSIYCVDSLQLWHTIKANWLKFGTGDRDLLDFDFIEKGLGLVSPPHFVYDF